MTATVDQALKSPKGRCTHCGRKYALWPDGTVHGHYLGWALCKGSQHLPKEEK